MIRRERRDGGEEMRKGRRQRIEIGSRERIGRKEKRDKRELR